MVTVRPFFAGVLVCLVGGGSSISAESLAVRQVVRAGQAAPGGGTFEHFTVESQPIVAPVNSKGEVAFFATLLRGPAGEGLFLGSGESVRKVALEGDRAPGGGSLSGFGSHPVPALNDAGAVAFAAAVFGGKTVEGIFVASRGRVQAIAVAGESAPGIPSGTLASLEFPALNARGDVTFLATVRRRRESLEAIYLRSGGKLRKVIAQEDPAPAGGAFARFGAPALNNRAAVVFAAVVEGRAVPGGVFVAEGGRVRMVVGAGDDAPIGGIFAKFSDRISFNDAGSVAFNAILKNGPVEEAVFVLERGRLRRVAALGDSAPGGGTFSHFGHWPALSADGAVAFIASVDHGPAPMAAFLATPRGTVRIAALGDALPTGGTLSSFGLYPVIAISPRGALSFAATPTATGEGVEAIFTVEPPPG